MSRSNNKFPMTNIGITTIITVFIVLCLVTFASLSYVNVLNDSKLSNQVAEHNNEYYDVYNQANKQIASIADSLDISYNNYLENGLGNIEKEYSFTYDVGNDHCLYVTIIPAVTSDTELNGLTPVQYMDNNLLSLYTITRFEIAAASDWNGDNNVLPLKTLDN